MLGVLRHPTYAILFSAQVVALLGTGLLTVALALLAYDLAGADAGVVLGTALAIKMVAYVALAPIAHALADRLPRKAVLIGADLVRAGVALFLPFVDAVWQIYLLVFVLQAASATFTPAFQATIPDILENEDDYTKALALSRLAYDLENLLSPTLAGMLLMVAGYHWLFAGTMVGFLASAALVRLAPLPERRTERKVRPFLDRVTRGARIYLATPRLRGLLALNLCVAATGAFVLVNTVVVVRTVYGAGESAVALALAAFGLGSMVAAVVLPGLLGRVSDRIVMLGAGLASALIGLGLAVWWLTGGPPAWGFFLACWSAIGCLFSAVQTPSGRLLRRSAHAEDRPAIFTAQFALSHACWLLTYPLAGLIGAVLGLPQALLLLGLIGLMGAAAAHRLWPRGDPDILTHSHADLPPDHPHLREHGLRRGRHRHVFVIDDEHPAWPGRG